MENSLILKIKLYLCGVIFDLNLIKMRIKLEFVTKNKIDHEFYGVDLTEIYCSGSGETLFYYQVLCWNEVKSSIKELLKSDIVIDFYSQILI
jgi:hypothetical protein